MSPSVTDTISQEVLKGGILTDGEYMPAGITAETSFYFLHHSLQYYADPFSYGPERWIEGSSPELPAESVVLA